MKKLWLVSVMLSMAYYVTAQDISYEDYQRMLKSPEGVGEILNYLNAAVAPTPDDRGIITNYYFRKEEIVRSSQGILDGIPWDKLRMMEIYTDKRNGVDDTNVNIILDLPDLSGNSTSAIQMKAAGGEYTEANVIRYLRIRANRFGKKEFAINGEIYRRRAIDYTPQLQQQQNNYYSNDTGGISVETADAFQSALGDKWDFVGSAAFASLKDEGIDLTSSAYIPIKKYEFTEARLRISYGMKKFRILVSPLGFNWLVLPSYKKYDEQGTQIDYDDFGSMRYYSPSVGFAFCPMSTEGAEDLYRVVEFPITFEFAPLLGGKSKDVEVKNIAYDDEFSAYFTGFKYMAKASIGIDLYPSDGFGFGFAIGYTYASIHATKEKLTETIDVSGNQVQRDFTFKLDKASSLMPYADLRIMLRF